MSQRNLFTFFDTTLVIALCGIGNISVLEVKIQSYRVLEVAIIQSC